MKKRMKKRGIKMQDKDRLRLEELFTLCEYNRDILRNANVKRKYEINGMRNSTRSERAPMYKGLTQAEVLNFTTYIEKKDARENRKLNRIRVNQKTSRTVKPHKSYLMFEKYDGRRLLFAAVGIVTAVILVFTFGR